MNRRDILCGAAAFSIGVPVVAVADQPEMTAQERFDHHLAELKKVAKELDPRIGAWQVARAEDDDLGCVVCITAFRVTGRYEGDGTYERGRERVTGGRTKYEVRLLDHEKDGHRVFSVRTPMDRMELPEPSFNTFIGRKIA